MRSIRDLPRILLAALVTAAFVLPGAEMGAAQVANAASGGETSARIAHRDAAAAFAAAVEAGADPAARELVRTRAPQRETI
jgi:hypothetical protein